MKKETGVTDRIAEVISQLSDDEQTAYQEFMTEVRRHVDLSRKHTERMIRDFESAILFYLDSGVSLEEALRRLDPVNLGGFYVNQDYSWYPLDNAAIVYPLSMKFGQMPVFRLSVYLKKPVEPAILQMALNFVIKRFPVFATTVKTGVFWHYLDSTKKRFKVDVEKYIPCQPIKVSKSRAQSFRVIYYENRISVEYFHILTDGNGGLVFLNSLVGEYLRLLGHDIRYTDNCLDPNQLVDPAEVRNEFASAEITEGANGFTGTPAVQMSGKLSYIKPCQVLHFELNVDQVRKAAHNYGTTITGYLLGVMFLAQRAATEDTSGEIKIQVPINMRKFNKSRTLRNYSMYFSCDLPIADILKLQDIIPQINTQLKERSTEELMNAMMTTTIKLIKAVRLIPLVIKRPVVKMVYGFLGEGIFSNVLSNLGQVRVDRSMAPYIDKYDFVLGTSDTFRATCSAVSFGNKLVFSVSKMTKAPTFEERLYRIFTEEGLDVEMTGSGVYED